MNPDHIADVLANRYFIALIIPLALLLIGAVAKKLVRGTAWVRSDFWLGMDLALAGMSAGFIYLYELVRASSGAPPVQQSSTLVNKLLVDTGFLVVSCLGLLWVLALHQDHERNTGRPAAQFWLLAVVGNGVGALILVVFIVVVKGVV
jgi:dipeptide/tripeptide permease